MASREDIATDITPQVLIKAYSCGIFPMAESAEESTLYWIEPQHRGIMPMDAAHVPRRLARSIRACQYDLRVDHDFAAVIDGCAAVVAGRRSTWINQRIRDLYAELFDQGYCHTVELWQGSRMVGGLYGVALGGAFFGESMFSVARDSSKIALVYLIARLIHGGFTLLDTQFVTEHLRQFGTIEVDRTDFHLALEAALPIKADFHALPADTPPETILDIIARHGNDA